MSKPSTTSKLGAMPAFPVCEQGAQPWNGMTYRQWLVGMAMQGMLASDAKMEAYYDIVASDAVKHAAAVLAELEKQP